MMFLKIDAAPCQCLSENKVTSRAWGFSRVHLAGILGNTTSNVSQDCRHSASTKSRIHRKGKQGFYKPVIAVAKVLGLSSWSRNSSQGSYPLATCTVVSSLTSDQSQRQLLIPTSYAVGISQIGNGVCLHWSFGEHVLLLVSHWNTRITRETTLNPFWA